MITRKRALYQNIPLFPQPQLVRRRQAWTRQQQLGVFSSVSPEQQTPHDQPLRQLRIMADEALRVKASF
jgi:hypothetical protein